MKDSEKEILQLFKDGDSRAMDLLYTGYAGYIAGVCSRYVSNKEDLHDVMQESFIKIITKLPSFEYRGKGSLKAWITKVAVNESLRFLKNGNLSLFVDTEEEFPTDFADEAEPDVKGMDMADIAKLIAEMPTGYKTVFNLYAIDGRSHKEIAEMLNIRPNTSASQYLRAKNMLARMIREYRKKEEQR